MAVGDFEHYNVNRNVGPILLLNYASSASISD